MLAGTLNGSGFREGSRLHQLKHPVVRREVWYFSVMSTGMAILLRNLHNKAWKGLSGSAKHHIKKDVHKALNLSESGIVLRCMFGWGSYKTEVFVRQAAMQIQDRSRVFCAVLSVTIKTLKGKHMISCSVPVVRTKIFFVATPNS